MASIYISSTFNDLEDCRKAICAQLRRLEGHRIVAMEDYVACDERPLDKCLEDVGKCDVYVGIFAWRYGFVPKAGNPENKSITELEYRHAKALSKPCLLFLLDAKTPWSPEYLDQVTLENDRGARIKSLRDELRATATISFFNTPAELAGLVSAAIQNWEKKPSIGPSMRSDSTVRLLNREVQSSVLLAYVPANEELAKAVASALDAGASARIVLSPTALFAEKTSGFSSLEESAIRCETAMVLLTPAALDQLAPRAENVARALGLLRARLGPLGALTFGTDAAQIPSSWGIADAFEVSTPNPLPAVPSVTLPAAVQAWLSTRLPPLGSRTVGLPLTVLSMTAAECEALLSAPGWIGDRLGNAVQRQFDKVASALASADVKWFERYGSSRDGWQPFGPQDRSVGEIVEEIARGINERQPEKLRKCRIKLQWYPFDVLKAKFCEDDSSQDVIYKNMARSGCVLVIDEMSLFHPDLNESFRSSPLFNSEQIAMVTLSPFDPHHGAVDQLLDVEPRRKLAGAFERFSKEYDPQCELAVSDPRRLRRWLHSSLPETVTNLRAPRPDQDAMRAFFAESGLESRATTGDYPWAGGGQT